jgi:hypothetical protein
MSIWKKREGRLNFKNYWLQKSEQKREEKEWNTKLEEIAKTVTKFIRSN